MTRVLLVEHDPAARDRLALALRHARFEVRSAGDAEGGLRLVSEANPDVAVFAPHAGMALREFCAAARAAAGERPLAVVALLDGDASTAAAVRGALLDGADDALPRAVEGAVLVESIRAREMRAPASTPTVAADAGAHAAIESALVSMPRPTFVCTMELEDAAAIASAEGFEALRELDELWRARIRALVPEQAAFFPGPLGQAILLLPGSTPQPRALLAALGGTGQPAVRVGSHDLRIRAAIGVLQVGTGEAPPSAEIALARSRHALGIARRGPQPRLHFHAEHDRERDLRHAHVAAMLQRALEQGAFRLVYQPKVSILTGRLVGAEALIRWTLPTTGEAVPATRLLAIAEDAGLLDEIGSWALREACRQCAAWSNAGADIPVSVNIAASQFRRGDLEDEVRMALTEAALPGRLLTIEVQEGVLHPDAEGVRAQLEAIRVAGARVSVDDFGTGIAGIAVLRGFPLDELKIDRTVVARLPGSAEDRATVDTALRHARQLGIECVAEGVEHAAQWAFLAERGWHAAQGWHIAHPMSAAEVPAFARHDLASTAGGASAAGGAPTAGGATPVSG
jgi:EAL domain-containing protein (putative c-di-GMP-specific phosphodiesterase class I)/DNA-binding NarL/FixJ family response regulator